MAATGAMVYLGFSSNSTGPAGTQNAILTGGPRSDGKTCAQAGCHNPPGAGSTNAYIAHFVDKTTQQPTQSYIAGRTYTLRISGFNSSGRNNWGLQVVAMRDSDSSQAGSFFIFNPDLISRQVQGIQVIEHQHRIYSPGSLIVDLDWTAPVSSAGPITFYGIMNCVDSNLNQSNDNPSQPFSLSILDHTYVESWKNEARFEVYPNPVRSQAVFKMDRVPSGDYQILLGNLHGQTLLEKTVSVYNTGLELPLDLSSCAPGIYYLKVAAADHPHQKVVVIQRQ